MPTQTMPDQGAANIGLFTPAKACYVNDWDRASISTQWFMGRSFGSVNAKCRSTVPAMCWDQLKSDWNPMATSGW